MDAARIAALLEPFIEQPLQESQLEQISIYIDLLLRWNARINLTAIRKEEEIVTRHFGESFFLARHLFPVTDHRPLSTVHCVDIGSGAGFPALPLKIWAPDIHLTLIESNHKKAAFLNEAARALTLMNVDMIAERTETVAARPDFRPADVVTFRAVEHFETILPQAVAFLAGHGRLALLIGAAQLPRLAALTTLEWHPKIHVPQSHARVLAIGVNR
ncbi:MAG: 16S rRNA (guanine(527)-N(7))-methyltransferase RsmG [Terriglobales bacterium]